MLIRKGADALNSGRIYVAVVQTVLLYGSETWVMTLHIGRVLGGFYHRIARRLMIQQSRRGGTVDGCIPL